MDMRIILGEAVRLQFELAKLDRPNSPSGTHYMVRISDDYVREAISKDQDILLSYLSHIPYVYMSNFSNLNGYCVLTNRSYVDRVLKNGDTKIWLLARGRKYALLVRETVMTDAPKYIVAYDFHKKGNKCMWCQGHYIYTIEGAIDLFLEKTGRK